MAVFNHTKHKELWNWLADNPGKDEADWPGWTENRPRNLCFACEVVDYFHYSCGEACPLQWGSEDNKCCNPGSPYYTWLRMMGKFHNSKIKQDGKVTRGALDTYKGAIRLAALGVANLSLRDIENVEVI